MKIACCDTTKAPKTAKGTLGMFVIDFGFEREIIEEGTKRILKCGIKVRASHNQSLQEKKSSWKGIWEAISLRSHLKAERVGAGNTKRWCAYLCFCSCGCGHPSCRIWTYCIVSIFNLCCFNYDFGTVFNVVGLVNHRLPLLTEMIIHCCNVFFIMFYDVFQY